MNNINSFIKKNKFAYTAIRMVKENIISAKDLLYNPIFLIGLNKTLRYQIFWSIFDKNFNTKYRNTYIYKNCNELDLDMLKNKKLVIIENAELLINDEILKNKIKIILKKCFEQKIQVIICSNIDISKLEINEVLKSKMLNELKIYLE